MSDKHKRAASLVVKLVPQVMRALASDWRHVEHSPDPGHFYILLILIEGPANLSYLASQLQVTLPSMSNSISTLVERGWVARHRDPEDGRRVLIDITPEGCGVLERIRDVAQVHIERTLQDLTNAECDQVIAGLQALGQVIDNHRLPCK